MLQGYGDVERDFQLLLSAAADDVAAADEAVAASADAKRQKLDRDQVGRPVGASLGWLGFHLFCPRTTTTLPMGPIRGDAWILTGALTELPQ